MNSFWRTFYNTPKHRIAITGSLPKPSAVVARPRCATARRLEMARQMATGATDTTACALATRVIADWWQGFTVDRFRQGKQVQL